MSSEMATSAEAGGAQARTVIADVRRHWRWLLASLALGFILSVAIVRTVPPTYEAVATIAELKPAAGGSALAALSGGLLGESSSFGELRAVLGSSQVAQALASAPSLRSTLARGFPEPTDDFLSKLRRTIVEDIFGRKNDATFDLAERIQTSLKVAVLVKDSDGLAEVSYRHPDREVAEPVLRAALVESQRILTQRQLQRALEEENYLVQALSRNSNPQLTSEVLRQLLYSAIGKTMRLRSGGGAAFDIVDEARAGKSPVGPRIGLVVAVCLALSAAAFLGILAARRLLP